MTALKIVAKKLIWAMAAFAVSLAWTCSAAEDVGQVDFGEEWKLNKWEGYMPLPEYSVKSEEGGLMVTVGKTQGRMGAAVTSKKRVKVTSRDIVIFSFEAKGTEAGFTTLYQFDADGKWLGPIKENEFELSDDWKPFSFQFMLTDKIVGNGSIAVGQIAAALGVRKGGSASFRKIAVEIVNGGEEFTYEYKAKPAEEFDPVREGWKLVFKDDFNGPDINTNVWEMRTEAHGRECVGTDSNGLLRIMADLVPGTSNLMTGSIWSKRGFSYGYFESRLKFTHEPCWWAAFWLCPLGMFNSFINGFEIDIMEDYFTRAEKPGAPYGKTIDHNEHIMAGLTCKSQNFNTELPGSLDDWYVIGCKWTPFEITYYLNGKVLRPKVRGGAYDTVTFDAFRNGNGFGPARVRFSGELMQQRKWGKRDLTGGKFPEFFNVDWVKVYEYPGAADGMMPTAELTSDLGGRFALEDGAKITFRAKVAESAKQPSKIRAVHLFDSGFHLATLKTPPYVFEVPFSERYFMKTAWARPGRQRLVPVFAGSLHAFAVYAEGENGIVGHSNAIEAMALPKKRSTPYKGRAVAIPGKVKAGYYDDGGQGVAYCDTTPGNKFENEVRPGEWVDGYENIIGAVAKGEWVNYSVDAKESRNYRFTINYGSIQADDHYMLVLADDKLVGRMELRPDVRFGYRPANRATCVFPLAKGLHRITLYHFGTYNYGDLEFE